MLYLISKSNRFVHVSIHNNYEEIDNHLEQTGRTKLYVYTYDDGGNLIILYRNEGIPRDNDDDYYINHIYWLEKCLVGVTL